MPRLWQSKLDKRSPASPGFGKASLINARRARVPGTPASNFGEINSNRRKDKKMSGKKDNAIEAFCKGYNCCQSVLSAFCEDLGLDTDLALMLSSGFGGGMGRLREVCGAVSAMFMLAGLKNGYTKPEELDKKTLLYKDIQDLAAKFKAKNGTIICRELLKNIKTTPGYIPELRTKEYYHVRPCVRYIRDAAEIIDEYLNNTENKKC